MLIVYGQRSYGRVHGCAGEYAQTDFGHLYYLPLIPDSSFWVTRTQGEAVFGFEIRTCPTSVIATYLRWWGPVFATLALVFGGTAGAIAAAPIVAGVIYGWRLRSVRNARALRQGDGDRLVFGSRCPPALMKPGMRQDLRRRLDERWAKLSGGRSPEDVVRFGARTQDEALFAYGLLRLAAVDHRDPAAAAAADRILDGLDTESPAGSPYRGVAGVAFSPLADETEPSEPAAAAVAAPEVASDWSDRTLCAFGACVGVIGPDGACKACGKRPGVDVEAPRPLASAERRHWWSAPISAGLGFAVVFAGIASIALAEWGAFSLLPTTDADAAFLARTASSRGFVEVACDKLELYGQFTDGTKAYACTTGDRVLPVAGALESTAPGTKLVGVLHDFSESYAWPPELRHPFTATAGYLDVRSSALRVLRRLAGAAGLLGLLAIAGGYVLARRRRAAARRAVR